MPVATRKPIRFSLRTMLIGCVIAAGLAYSVKELLNAMQTARDITQDSMSFGRLFKIDAALRLYLDEHGHYPPAYSTDDQGRPLLSWRVHLLPYLGYDQLYRQFDLTQPWDSPTNYRLLAAMPEDYSLGIRNYDTKSGHTSVAGVMSDQAFFLATRGRDDAQITDDRSTTLTLVEIPNGRIFWTEPKDLELERMSFTLNDSQQPCLGSTRWRGPLVMGADQRYHELRSDVAPEMLRALLTIAGGEDVAAREVFALKGRDRDL